MFHYAVPDFARRPVLCNFLKEIVVRVEKETQPRPKIIHMKAASLRPFDVLDAVIKRERQFLQSSRTRLANVISAD